MTGDAETKQLINKFEKALKRYKRYFSQNPGSVFYAGLVKNTEEHIEELKAKTKK